MTPGLVVLDVDNTRPPVTECLTCGAGTGWRPAGHADWCEDIRATLTAPPPLYGPDDVCAEDDCDTRPHARGLCSRHYMRWWNNQNRNTA